MWGGEGAARGSSVLTSCRVQANPPKWKGRGCLERWLSANSVCLRLLSGKNMQSSGRVCVPYWRSELLGSGYTARALDSCARLR